MARPRRPRIRYEADVVFDPSAGAYRNLATGTVSVPGIPQPPAGGGWGTHIWSETKVVGRGKNKRVVTWGIPVGLVVALIAIYGLERAMMIIANAWSGFWGKAGAVIPVDLFSWITSNVVAPAAGAITSLPGQVAQQLSSGVSSVQSGLGGLGGTLGGLGGSAGGALGGLWSSWSGSPPSNRGMTPYHHQRDPSGGATGPGDGGGGSTNPLQQAGQDAYQIAKWAQSHGFNWL